MDSVHKLRSVCKTFLVLLLNIKNPVFVIKRLQLSSTHLGACHSGIISGLITRESGLFRSGLRSWLDCR